MMSTYLETVENVYEQAALTPDANLCCIDTPIWRLPDLVIPPIMQRMNYGCGSVVDPRDLKPGDAILYVGVGGGLEALQFAYFARRPGGVIAVDPVAAMRAKAAANLIEAAAVNSWFRPEYITVVEGSALKLPVSSRSVNVVGQNCLFNVFTEDDLDTALGEVVRVLKPGGFFATSDPITPTPLPAAFRADEEARARCLSGCQTFEDYLAALVRAGFGRIDVRARVPYRYVTPAEYSSLTEAVLLESIEVAAFKVPEGADGPAIFTGRSAIFTGPAEAYEDTTGTILRRGIPAAISDATAARLAKQPSVLITPPTYRAAGGCC